MLRSGLHCCAALAFLSLSACTLFQPNWQWEKAGASVADYDADVRFCKSQTGQYHDGTVTETTVRRIHACLEQHGWRKVNRETRGR